MTIGLGRMVDGRGKVVVIWLWIRVGVVEVGEGMVVIVVVRGLVSVWVSLWGRFGKGGGV